MRIVLAALFFDVERRERLVCELWWGGGGGGACTTRQVTIENALMGANSRYLHECVTRKLLGECEVSG